MFPYDFESVLNSQVVDEAGLLILTCFVEKYGRDPDDCGEQKLSGAQQPSVRPCSLLLVSTSERLVEC